MKTTFKSPSAFNTTSFNSSSTINVELDSPANVNTEFNSSSNIAADTSNLDVKYLKMVIDKETGRYIKVDTESKPDFIILGLYSATNSFLSSCEFNVTGGVRVIDCSLDLSNKRLIITNSDDAHIYCDLTALLNVIDGKVTSNSPIQGATKTKITYDEKGLVTGGENLVALDIPVLPIGKITGLNDALFDKVQKNEPIIGSTATKITYDEKGLITGGTNLIKGDIPNIDATQVIEDTSHRFITDIEKTTWNNKSDFSGQYDDLENKPLINNIEIKGNISLEDLNINNFSGDYGDLSNKPIIPTKVSQLENDDNFATMSDIPVKVSDLENDAEFITLANIPTDLSSFNNDVGFALEADIPTNVSELINDAEFITAGDIPYIPVKISDLTNDTGFITKYVNDLVNYKSTEDLNVLLEDKVDKVVDKSLVLDTEIAHLVALDTQAELDEKFSAKENTANKGVANGYAPLNASGIVDPIYVPSAYTDYVEYATYANLPATGVEGTLYVVIADETSDNNTSTYRWTGSIYVNVTDKLSASEVKALYESNADTNAYTDDEKTKLSGIEPNAEVNIIEAIKIDGADLIPDVDKRITLPNKEPAFAKNTAFNKNFGNEENTVTQGNDARLSDARIPLPHNHDDRYYTESEIDTFFIQRGESEPEVKKGLWLDECVEGVGVDDVIIIKGTDLQVIGNVSGQIPILQDLIVKGAEISLIEGSSGQIQISGGEITIVNAEGVEEILIDETLTVSSVDMVSGTKYITIKNVIPII